MKGLAVLALGAILIWFGLSRDGAAPDSTVHAGEPQTEEGATAKSTERMDLQRRREPAQPERGVGEARQGSDGEGVSNANAPIDEYLAAADPLAAPTGRVEAEASRVEPTAQDSPEVEWASPEPRAERITAVAQPATPDLGRGQDGPIELSGGRGPKTEKVASFLLEAWISGDHSDLQIYLTQGEGAELPDVQRQLVASFWQAVGGYPDKARAGLDRIKGAEGITTAQESLLATALDDPGMRAVPRSASAGRMEPLSHAMRMVLLEDEARQLLTTRDYSRSAMAYSDLIQDEIRAPWAPHRQALLAWGAQLDQAQANHRFNVNGSWPSIEEKVQPGGNLIRLRKRVLKRRSDLVLCTGLIAEVNGVSGYVQANDIMRIPTDRVNVLVDLNARVLLYRHGDEVVKLWDVGIGKPGHETPIGVFRIGHKIEKPAHTTKGLPYGDPDNPLGTRWMGLRRSGQKKDTSYGIHGTWLPEGVGGAVSEGCVRMRNEDVNALFEILPREAEVVIQQ